MTKLCAAVRLAAYATAPPELAAPPFVYGARQFVLTNGHGNRVEKPIDVESVTVTCGNSFVPGLLVFCVYVVTVTLGDVHVEARPNCAQISAFALVSAAEDVVMVVSLAT